MTEDNNDNKNNGQQSKGYAVLSVVMLIAIGLFAGMLIGGIRGLKTLRTDTGRNNDVEQAIKTIERYYVDNIDSDSLARIMIESTLAALDPHSRYLTAEAAAVEEEQIRGNFEGIGISLHKRNDTIFVVNVFEDGPARHVGIRSGDKILAVDGVAVSGVEMSQNDVIKHIRGPHHTMIDLTIQRYGEKNPRHFKVERDIIDNPSIALSAMLDNEVGYIRINLFSATTYQEFCKAVASLKMAGMKDLILDLRDNGGGALYPATQLIDELLPGTETIMYTEGAHQRRQEVRSHRGGLFVEGRLAVMINEFSASASEVVSGAIQDNDRGIIVGRRSFGKGLVQHEYAMPNNAAILLTVAHYFTPSGRCIQRSYDDGADQYYASFVGQVLADYEADSLYAIVNDSTPYYTSRGRVVYGGGGIFPDYLVRAHYDSSNYYAYQLQSRYVYDDVSAAYVATHYDELMKQYPNRDLFLKNYSPNQGYIDMMIAEAKRKGVAYDAAGMKAHREEIVRRLKAFTGSLLYSGDTFYRVIFQGDSEIKECQRHLKAQPRYVPAK